MKRRQTGLVPVTLVLLGGVATFALAQQPATPPPAATPAPAAAPGAQAPATDRKEPKPKDERAAARPAPDTPPKPAAAQGSPQHFEPTEKVRPDFDVAFPVDI